MNNDYDNGNKNDGTNNKYDMKITIYKYDNEIN